jgi:putative MATE family efflux protein
MARTETLIPTADAGWQTIWQLSWPLLLSMGVSAGILLVDAWMAGWFGSAAQAAVAMAGQIAFLYIATTAVITIGVTALASRAIGAQDWVLARHTAGQAIWLALGISTCLGLPLYLAGPWLLGLLGIGGEVRLLAGQYLYVAMGGVPALAAWGVTAALLRAQGDSRSQLHAGILQAGAIIALEGLAVQRGWGVSGLAMANTIGDWILVVYGWNRLLASPLGDGIRGWPRPDRSLLTRIVRIGLPAGVQSLFRSAAGIVFAGAVAHAPQSTAVLAALNVGGRIESLAFLPAFALGLAASTLVGQSLGAQLPDMAWQHARRILKAALLLCLPICAVFLLAGSALAGWFSADPAVITHAASYLWWMGLTEPLLIASIVGTSVLQGAGDTRFPLMITIFSLYVFRLPLAYWLVPMYGANGAWMAMAVSMVVQGLLIMVRVRQGQWTRVRV